MTTSYETVVGMEVHAELATRTKVFCGCRIEFGRPPNTQVCPVCLGMPGSLPVLNKRAFELALKTALALNCEIAPCSEFERKNYYYPDLPKNYQISQLRKNLGTGGWLEIEVAGQSRRIGIDNVHLEEDAGKNIHLERPGADYSLVDLNRAGTPLLEIVSRPDMRSTEDSLAFMEGLKILLEYLEVSDCNMHEGRLRFEANISVRPIGSDKLGAKVEIKNLASMKIALKCIQYETARQSDLIESGGRVVQETRLWDEERGATEAMRSKEQAQDYRYFPDPDLVEVRVDKAWLEEIRTGLPELPAARRRRFAEQFAIPDYDAAVLTADKAVADYYEAALAEHDHPKALSNWVMTEVLATLKKEGGEIGDFAIGPRELGQLVGLIDEGTISGKIAKSVFKEMLDGGGDPEAIVREKGLAQVSDSGEIEKLVDEIIAANPDSVADFQAGRERALGYLTGQVMKASRGKANPKLANELIRKKLAL